MSRTWTAATPVRWSAPGWQDRYVSTSTACVVMPGRRYSRLMRGEVVEYENGVTYQLIPEAVAMADLPLENGR